MFTDDAYAGYRGCHGHAFLKVSKVVILSISPFAKTSTFEAESPDSINHGNIRAKGESSGSRRYLKS